MKLEYSRQIFEKKKIRENLSGRSRAVLCGRTDGRTDRHDEAMSRFSQFCERALKIRLLSRKSLGLGGKATVFARVISAPAYFAPPIFKG